LYIVNVALTVQQSVTYTKIWLMPLFR